jgi:predicted ester cyclase
MAPQTVMEQGDRVMARFRMTGTHRGEFMGVPPSGRRIDIEGYDEVRLVEGRASEHWGAMDGMALMQQLGAVPEGAPAG